MKFPKKWNHTKLEGDCKQAESIFRRSRGKESLTGWVEANQKQQATFSRLFRLLGVDGKILRSSVDASEFSDPALLVALRYLAAPPISQDDLKILSGTTKTWGQRAKNRQVLAKVIRVVYKNLDPVRFPWLTKTKKPTAVQLRTANIASSLLVTAQQVATSRRNVSKADQERLVKTVLRNAGFKEVRTRTIRNISDAPIPGEYCGECKLGTRKADVVVRLKDGRLLPIECKVSNSTLNSVKRVNNDAAVKATIWTSEFGTSLIVPAAVLAGVFDPLKLAQAQNQSHALYLFWAHRLDDLVRFVINRR